MKFGIDAYIIPKRLGIVNGLFRSIFMFVTAHIYSLSLGKLNERGEREFLKFTHSLVEYGSDIESFLLEKLE